MGAYFIKNKRLYDYFYDAAFARVIVLRGKSMETTQKILLFAPNLINVCIDSVSEGNLEGQLWQPYDVRPQLFIGMTDMLLQMDELYNRWNYPQRAMDSRTFLKETVATQPLNIRKGDSRMNIQKIQDKRGQQGTFIVQVQYRQNATWQGQVLWAEKNKKEYFRSALELIRMIDNAVSEEKDNRKEAEQ